MNPGVGKAICLERRWPATDLGYGYQVRYCSIHIVPFCRFPPNRRRRQVEPIPRPGKSTLGLRLSSEHLKWLVRLKSESGASEAVLA
jgi:hypothetical protein